MVLRGDGHVRWTLGWMLCLVVALGAFADTGSGAAAPDEPRESLQDTGEVPEAAAGIGERPPTEEAPLLVAGREIFRMRAPLGPFTARDRARAAAGRVREIVRAPRFDADQIRAQEVDGQYRIVLGERVLFTVLAADLTEEDRSSLRLAAETVARDLASAIEADRRARSPRRLVLSAALTLLVLVVVGVLGRLVLRGARRLRRKVEAWKGTVIRAIELRGLELLSADAQVKGALSLLRLLRAAVLILLAYGAVSVILTLFPWTQPYARASSSFVVTALASVVFGIVGYIPNLFMIALTVVVVRYISRFVGFLFDAVARGVLIIPGFHPELAPPTKQLSRWLIWTLALVVIFPYLPGSDTPAFRGIGVFAGLMLSLGSAGTIGNLMSGIVLTYTRSFSVGDRVRIADTTGDVIEHGLISTKIVTIKNEEITIPNAAILGNHIVNYTERAQGPGLILHTKVTIGYDAPWRVVHELLIEAARSTPSILDEPKPFVLQTSLDDFYVSYEINAYTRDASRQAATYGELHQNIQDKFNAAGVEIMSPHYRAMRDGNEATVPSGQRPAGYEPPAFRVRSLSAEGNTGSSTGAGR